MIVKASRICLFALRVLIAVWCSPGVGTGTASARNPREEHTPMPQDKSKELLDAIRAGDKTAIDALLQQQPGLLSFKAPNGSSVILLAVYYGHAELTELFVGHGAKLDVFEASASGDLGSVRRLVEGDPAAVNSCAPDGFYPLGLAAFFGHRHIVKFLLDRGADVTLAARNAQRVTALHGAVARRDVEIVRMLLKHGADPNAPQEKGFVPLHDAAANGEQAILQLLVEHGARVDARTDDGKVPYDLAISRGQREVAEWLRTRTGD
jgi:ankyrin repeat protein